MITKPIKGMLKTNNEAIKPIKFISPVRISAIFGIILGNKMINARTDNDIGNKAIDGLFS